MAKKLKFNCECCGAEFTRYESLFISRGGVARYCNPNCQTKHMKKENSTSWKGGEYISKESGDVLVLVESKDTKNNKNNIYRALKRIVAENALGRKLDRSECVIHVDGNKLNNDISNLFICGIGLTRSIFAYKTQPLPIKGNLDTYK